MSPPLAPIAMRTPISRVRSVTDTSMMFMIPIPPTRSDTPAIDQSSVDIVRLCASACASISVWDRIMKSSSWPGGLVDAVPLPQQRRDLVLRRA